MSDRLDGASDSFDLDFSQPKRQLFLKEMSAAARNYRGMLGPATGQEPDEASRQVQELLQAIGTEVARFSPVLDVRPIVGRTFTDRNKQVPADLAELMKSFKFFLVNVPITLVPREGWSFNNLECRLQFNPTKPREERPVAYQIFPQEVWKDLIRAHQSLEIGLDERLEFKADPSQLLPEQGQAALPIDAGVALKGRGEAGLIVGPFTYVVRRPEIISRGTGDVEVIWRLLGGNAVGHEEPKLGVVLKVPKTVESVDVVGVMRARRNFDLLAAGIGELLQFVKEKTAQFFRAGAPASDSQTWRDITARP